MTEVLSAGYRLLRVPQALILVDLELFLVLIDALEHVAVDNLDFCRHKVVCFLRELLEYGMSSPYFYSFLVVFELDVLVDVHDREEVGETGRA